ncbi:ATP-binding cassette domain-containing protein [Streptomyces sp. NPDC050145]|uniref:ATP-binding cassette domain-containing protein n=1 Tax=Streptomyces sp. NPDC050145 TaxID=3365602 RepID=UPI00379F414A
MTTTLSPPALSAAAVRKAYGEHVVLNGIDLDIPAGSVFALLGPNGAGKTTVVQILSTLIRADAGDIRVAGHDVARDPDAVRAAIGVTGQFSAVDGFLTGEENLLLMADLHHLPRQERRPCVTDLLARFDLVDAARKPALTYSGGMRRRLDLAMTLVGRPRVIFLDEPTTGLDPRSRRTMWDIIRRLVADEGVTIFLTTQYLDEADQLADRIAVLHQGKIVAQGTAEELKRQVGGGHITLRFAGARDHHHAARTLDVVSRDDEALTLQVAGRGDVRSLRALLDRLDHASLTVEELQVHTPDLDDVFFALTGNPVTEQEPVR